MARWPILIVGAAAETHQTRSYIFVFGDDGTRRELIGAKNDGAS